MKRILLVEDTDAHAKLVRSHVGRFEGPPVEVVRASTLSEALGYLGEGEFDAALLDLSLPDSAWENTLEVFVAAAPRLPLVVLTSLGDLELAADAVAGGADDYVVKSAMSPEVLQRALRYSIERKRTSEGLRRRTEELEQSNEALKHFAHTVAHELRQPLNATALHLGLLKLDLDAADTSVKEALENVEEGIADMTRMVTDLLAFASLEQADRLRDDCDLVELVADVLDDLAPLIQESAAKVDVSDLPVLRCNPRYMRHVFRNLLDNAIKYRGEAAPEVKVEAEDMGESWVISITDNGVGIDEEALELVFDMFRRAPARSQAEGSGVGLALCRRIVEHHSGTIEVVSEPGAGSTFRITLPKTVPAA